MADTDGLIKIDSAVKKFLLKSKMPLSEYDRFFEFTIDGYRELRLKVVNEGVTYKKVIPDNINSISFPQDLEEFIALGVPNQGEIWFLSPENKIITTTSLSGLSETLDPNDGEGVMLDKYQDDTYYARGGTNYAGYYTVEHNKRRIRVNSTSRTELLLVYVTSGTSTSTETYIPYKYLPALEAYVMWQDVAYVDGMENIALSRENTYARRRQELAELELDIDGIMQEIYKSYTMLPKR